MRPVPLLLFVDDADVVVELEESVVLGSKAKNFVCSLASPECMNEKPELVLEKWKGGQVS